MGKIRFIKFTKLEDDAKLPSRKHSSDVGLDVFALDAVRIKPKDRAIVRTGVALADLESNLAILVWPKSGLDARLGVHTGAGVIDPGYRGEILILLHNLGNEEVYIEKGSAIAQLVVVPFVSLTPSFGLSTDSDRGETGGILRELKEEK